MKVSFLGNSTEPWSQASTRLFRSLLMTFQRTLPSCLWHFPLKLYSFLDYCFLQVLWDGPSGTISETAGLKGSTCSSTCSSYKRNRKFCLINPYSVFSLRCKRRLPEVESGLGNMDYIMTVLSQHRGTLEDEVAKCSGSALNPARLTPQFCSSQPGAPDSRAYNALGYYRGLVFSPFKVGKASPNLQEFYRLNHKRCAKK